MSDYSKEFYKKRNDTFNRFIKSLERKESFEPCYTRHVEYLKQNKHLPFTEDEFYRSFRAKNFWRDLKDCGSWLTFHHFPKANKTKLFEANFCRRDKLCPACAVRRAYKQQNKFLQIFDSSPDLRSNDWYYIVIPVKHEKQESFEVVFSRVESIRKKLVQSLNNGRKGRDTVWAGFGGGMSSIETTVSKNGWNVHLNFILNAPKGFDLGLIEHRQIWKGKEKISYSCDWISTWLKSASGNGSYVHNVSKLDFSREESIKGSLVEVLKYSLKFSSLSNQDLLTFYVKTHRKRLFSVFGNMWGRGLDKIEFDGYSDAPDEEFIELIYQRIGYDYFLYSKDAK